MNALSRLRIAIQKSGRLNSDSLELLSRCGLKLAASSNSLFNRVENLPIDILFVRDDDIPSLVRQGICDLGIVGENVLLEEFFSRETQDVTPEVDTVAQLGFSRCRLVLAFPFAKSFQGPASLQGLRIATSYPYLLRQYLRRAEVEAEVMTISGSVEIAPQLGMADVVCDLVSTGRTLKENNLKEVDELIQSQAVLIKTKVSWGPEKLESFAVLQGRMASILETAINT